MGRNLVEFDISYFGDRPFNEAAYQRNEEMKEHDHAPMRQAIIDLVEKTKMKVLLCPEDKSQVEIGKEMIYDRLPKSILNRVVWRKDYWLTDEAWTIYTHSAGLFGLEMHSPLSCVLEMEFLRWFVDLKNKPPKALCGKILVWETSYLTWIDLNRCVI